MTIRIATFNLENLFTRPVAMNSAKTAEGTKAIEDHALANAIIAKDVYSAADKTALLKLEKKYGWAAKNPPKNALVQFQKVRGQLFRSPQGKPKEVVANGRDDWTGWFELRREDVTWAATYNTGRVIAETKPDILLLVEIENRPTLKRFNEQVLKAEFKMAFPHFMVIDGNDDRGIDVGIASRFPIEEIRSHVDDADPRGNTIFSRDCPEFDIILPGDKRIVVIPNHFKSKRSGNDRVSVERRKAQAKRANAIAREATERSKLVLIGGDLNDTPDSEAIREIFPGGFRDVIDHPSYPKDRPGTYATGLAGNKIDYLISSPDLFAKLRKTGIERRGTYHPKLWDSFDTVTRANAEASDHHLVWADFDL